MPFTPNFVETSRIESGHGQYGDRIGVLILRNYGVLSCVLCIRYAKHTHILCHAERIFDPPNYFVGFDECWLLRTL